MTSVQASDAKADGRAPRIGGHRNGNSPQHLLITLLGDYWLDVEEPLPSAALVDIVGEFGVTQTAARGALSRMCKAGLLERRKRSRNTFYALTDLARLELRDGARRIAWFGLVQEPWDGQWTVAAYSLPEEHRDLRHLVRSRLRWLGFAPLYDGMWVAPKLAVKEVAKELAALQVSNASVFTAREHDDVSSRPLLSAWDLDELRSRYDGFLKDHAGLLDDIRNGNINASQALIARTRIMNEYRRFLRYDPGLPDELMPASQPRSRVREVFVEMYDALGELAAIRVRQIISNYADELGDHVSPHTVEQMRLHPLDGPAPKGA